MKIQNHNTHIHMATTGSDSFSERTRTRKNDHVACSEEMPYLSEEIVVDILSRLPVKSLLRFKCVCKSWLSLFSDPKLVKMHLLHMSSSTADVDDDDDDDNNSRRRLIVTGYNKRMRSCKSWTLNSIYSDGCDDKDEEGLDFPIKKGTLIGSCDGLICMHFDEDIFLWNPHLRESRILPSFLNDDLRLKVYDDDDDHYFAYGFGYDHSIDDYKVVAILCQPGEFNGYTDTQVHVYTSKTDSWRIIQKFPHGSVPCQAIKGVVVNNGIFVCGSLHWISIDDETETFQIFALDLATETFHEVALFPPYGSTEDLDFVLWVLRGCLCVAIVDKVTTIIDLWMLKKYGVRESWNKFASFPFPGGFPGPGYRAILTPLFVSSTDILLWKFGSHILRYNLKDNTLRSSVVGNFFTNVSNSAIYFESLVSPNAAER